MDKVDEPFPRVVDQCAQALSAEDPVKSDTSLLYKYVSPDRVFTCLPEIGNGALRATQPLALNDPFECAVRSSFIEDSEEEGNRSFSEALTSLHPPRPVSESEVAEARAEDGGLPLREMIARQLSEGFGIVSFGARHDQLLMWSHYAMNCSGFVIGYDIAQLAKLTSREGGLLPVRYRESLPLIGGYAVLEDNNVNALLSHKGILWEYEQEWRMIVNLSDTMGTGKSDKRGQPVNVVSVPNEAVCRVYYTERTPADAVARIAGRLSDAGNRYNTNAPVKLIQSAEKYGYEAVAVEPATVKLGNGRASE